MAEPLRRAPDNGDRGLMSASTSAAVDSAFNTLAQTVLVQNGRTLEDLVREMLRPMLKTWLDDNLPGMVERLVRAEIERVSRESAGQGAVWSSMHHGVYARLRGLSETQRSAA